MSVMMEVIHVVGLTVMSEAQIEGSIVSDGRLHRRSNEIHYRSNEISC